MMKPQFDVINYYEQPHIMGLLNLLSQLDIIDLSLLGRPIRYAKLQK